MGSSLSRLKLLAWTAAALVALRQYLAYLSLTRAPDQNLVTFFFGAGNTRNYLETMTVLYSVPVVITVALLIVTLSKVKNSLPVIWAVWCLLLALNTFMLFDEPVVFELLSALPFAALAVLFYSVSLKGVVRHG